MKKKETRDSPHLSSLKDKTHKVRALEIELVGNTDIVIELAAIPDCYMITSLRIQFTTKHYFAGAFV